MTERLLDINELSDYLKLEKQTLYNWLHQRKIPGIKVGGVWRFERRLMEDWLKRQTVKAKLDPKRKENKRRRNA